MFETNIRLCLVRMSCPLKDHCYDMGLLISQTINSTESGCVSCLGDLQHLCQLIDYLPRIRPLIIFPYNQLVSAY